MAIDPDARLRDSPEEQVVVSLPAPLNARLDALVTMANNAGENTSRKEVLAVLVLQADARGEDLLRGVRAYRVATAAEAVPEGVAASEILDIRSRKPGPRPRRTNS